jgi:hypothetical protein
MALWRGLDEQCCGFDAPFISWPFGSKTGVFSERPVPQATVMPDSVDQNTPFTPTKRKKTDMAVWVGNRKVFVNTMGTQTVKICTAQNVQGQYEKYYRIRPPSTLPQPTMVGRVQGFQSIADLEKWLINDRKASREPQNEVKGEVTSCPLPPVPLELPGEEEEDDDETAFVPPETTDILSEILGLVAPSAYSPDTDAWLPQAKESAEGAINTLVQEFIEFPYLHRVEHSIHARLFALLASSPHLSGQHPIGHNFGITQLIHKEWPETIPREIKGNRRGNFDLVVLSPCLLASCVGIDLFLDGRLPAPIVIEMGLDYDGTHLANDAKKLINSKPKHGYLVHLLRDIPLDPSTEQIILGIEAKTGIRTAYANVTGNHRTFKLVTEDGIVEA